MVSRSNSGEIVRRASLEGVAVDLERQVGERVVEGHGPRTVPSRRPAKMSRCDRGAALLGAHRADRPRRGAARRGRCSRACPARASGWARCSACCSSTWLIWLGGTSTLVPYGTGSAALWIALVCALGLLAWVRGWEGRRAVARGEPRGRLARRRWRRLAARAPEPDPLRRRLFWGAEAVFARRVRGMALLVAYSPDVWNTEKPMDMAFMTAANRADTFPPADPWLAGADLNYYYLGHLGDGDRSSSSRARRARRGLQPRGRRAVRARRRRRVHARRHAVGRGARRSAGRSGPGWPASGSCSWPATSRARGC